MRTDTGTIWVPNPRKVGIYAPLGWSASVGHVVRHRMDFVPAQAVTLKEGET